MEKTAGQHSISTHHISFGLINYMLHYMLCVSNYQIHFLPVFVTRDLTVQCCTVQGAQRFQTMRSRVPRIKLERNKIIWSPKGKSKSPEAPRRP